MLKDLIESNARLRKERDNAEASLEDTILSKDRSERVAIQARRRIYALEEGIREAMERFNSIDLLLDDPEDPAAREAWNFARTGRIEAERLLCLKEPTCGIGDGSAGFPSGMTGGSTCKESMPSSSEPSGSAVAVVSIPIGRSNR